MFDFLQYSFMQRALVGGVILSLLLALFGIFVVARRMSFFGDGIAHASLAGIAIGIFFGLSPLPAAMVFSALMAVLIYWLERKTNLFSDTVISIFFTASLAFGIILLSLRSGYQPQLVNFLFGNILTISSTDLFIMIGLGLVLLILFAFTYKKLALITFDPEGAYLAGLPKTLLELLLYISLSVTVVLGVKLLGIVLVSAFLVIPVSSAKLFSTSFRSLTFITIVLAEIITLSGIVISYSFDLPTSGVIVLTGFSVFLLSLLLKRKA